MSEYWEINYDPFEDEIKKASEGQELKLFLHPTKMINNCICEDQIIALTILTLLLEL